MKGHEREVTSTGTPPWKSPVALSVALHLLIIGIALAGWTWTSPDHEPPPRSISARLISQQPEPSPVVEPVDQSDREEERRAEEQKRKAEERRQEEARKAAEKKAREQAEQKAEEERKRKQALAQKRKEEKAKAEEEAARQKAEAEAKERQRKKAEEEKRKQEEAKRKAEEEQRRLEEQRKREEAERKKREEEARKEAERKRQEAERRLKEQQLEALADEAEKAKQAEAQRQAQAAAARAREAQMLTESEKYQALIRERLKNAWYLPSSATENMVARLQITLLPTGELADVRLVSSSGNTAFDNSALSAVRGVGRYPIPDERDTFERYFRQFEIEFNPRRLR